MSIQLATVRSPRRLEGSDNESKAYEHYPEREFVRKGRKQRKKARERKQGKESKEKKAKEKKAKERPLNQGASPLRGYSSTPTNTSSRISNIINSTVRYGQAGRWNRWIISDR